MKINIITKIPNKEKIELTSNILLHNSKKKLSNYPYFTDSVLFPREKLQYLNYDEIVTFFFNKREFITMLKLQNNIYTKKNQINKSNFTRKDNIKYNSNSNEIKNKNFILMLELLFPTTLPLVNNIETSLSYILKDKKETIPFQEQSQNNSFLENTIPILQFLPLNISNKFSYLKINNNIYTITHTIWINDVMNHPIYKDILSKYHTFEKWKIKYEINLEENDHKNQTEIVKYIIRVIGKNNNKLDFDKAQIKYIPSSNSTKILIQNYNEAFHSLKKISNFTDINNNKKIIELFSIITNIFYILNKSYSYRSLFRYYDKIDSIGKRIKDYELKKDINDYILDLNFEYLNEDEDDNNYRNNKSYTIKNKISNYFPEFNNFVKSIYEMKNRKIDNPIWKKVITKIIDGEKDHNFKSLWNNINVCYSFTEIKSEEKQNETMDYKEKNEKMERIQKLEKLQKLIKKEEQKKRILGGNNKCNNTDYKLNVGFDIIKSSYKKDDKEYKNDENTKIIEVYLQMDVIEGEINNENVHLFNCIYNDMYLGNMYHNLLYNSKEEWNIKEQLIFFSAKKILENDKKNKKNDKNQKLENNIEKYDKNI
jgi:hypothetical protein